ncbi:hypothetical protein BJ170DRAFT_698081 [Xylariales sp. AK1849]|nr:hypothetical protein BJ170DRAFT_698081 [Xylariales sp. AK1849]
MMPSLVLSHADLTQRQDATSSPVSKLSQGAIVGIAVGGSIILFVVVASLLVRNHKRQYHQRGILDSARPHSVTSDHGPEEKLRHNVSTKRRLQKKAIVDEETRQEHTSLPILPPVFLREESFNLTPFTGDEGQQSQIKEKQRGLDAYQMRKKKSWIDEDALHGPRVSPRKKSSKGGISWFGGTRRPMSDVWVVRSPTLPHTEHEIGFREMHEHDRSETYENGTWEADNMFTAPRPAREADLRSRHRRRHTTSQVPSSSPPIAPIPKPPSAMIHNLKHRIGVAHDAAQQLAGRARVPVPQQPPRLKLKQNVTDTELTEILRMTAERLQDRTASTRRQTVLIQSTRRDSGESAMFEVSRYSDSIGNSRTPSPTKSQRSAPAIMVFSEQEATEASPTRAQGPEHSTTLRYSRQISELSMLSEPDSLVVRHRVSHPEHQTALSSPSRGVKPGQPTSQEEPQPFGHFPTASSGSSALSTLYSESGEMNTSEGSRNAGKTSTQMERAAMLEALTFSQAQDNRGEGDHRPRFEDCNSPGPSRRKRATTDQVPVSPPRSEPKPAIKTDTFGGHSSKKKSFSFSIRTGDDDPFIMETPKSQEPLRVSQVFTPIPSTVKFLDNLKAQDAGVSGYANVQVTEPAPTPTPPPKSQHRVLPSTPSLRPVGSSPTLGALDRRPSRVPSEDRLSSIYDGCSSYDGMTLHPSTATLFTVSTYDSPPTSRLPTGLESRADYLKEHDPDHIMRLGPGSRVQRTASENSARAQDTVPPPTAPTQGNLQVRDAVAELRRMNSSVSSFGGYRSVTPEMDSPIIPDMRGDGLSPGKRNSGAKNYLALGTSGQSTINSGIRDVDNASPLTSGDVRSRRGTLAPGSWG